jgi:hypothetical protein
MLLDAPGWPYPRPARNDVSGADQPIANATTGGEGSPLMAELEVRVLSGNAEKVLIDYWHPLRCNMYPAGMLVRIFRGLWEARCFVCSHPQGRLYVAYSKEQPTLI